jgi:hypothetical protein
VQERLGRKANKARPGGGEVLLGNGRYEPGAGRTGGGGMI